MKFLCSFCKHTIIIRRVITMAAMSSGCWIAKILTLDTKLTRFPTARLSASLSAALLQIRLSLALATMSSFAFAVIFALSPLDDPVSTLVRHPSLLFDCDHHPLHRSNHVLCHVIGASIIITASMRTAPDSAPTTDTAPSWTWTSLLESTYWQQPQNHAFECATMAIPFFKSFNAFSSRAPRDAINGNSAALSHTR